MSMEERDSTHDNITNTGGELIARIIQRHGVKRVFTLTGGHISPILVALKSKGIEVVDTRHEANAVFAADATARVTGRVGVAIVTAGPGVTNSITPLMNAKMAESPVLLIGGATATILKGRGSLQDIDQLSLVKSIVKWYKALKTTREIENTLEAAFLKAKEGVPGPVFIEAPVDLLYPEEVVKDLYGVSEEKPAKNIGEKL